jgi:hypothetical protein
MNKKTLVATLVGLMILSGAVFSQSEVRAEPLGIELSQHMFPEGSQVSGERLITDENEPSHPLFRGEVPEKPLAGGDTITANDGKPNPTRKIERKVQHNYQSVKSSKVHMHDQKIEITSFKYEYASPQDAKAAAKSIRAELTALNGIKPIKLAGGQAFHFVGPDGDDVYWFVGSKGPGLALILINGFDNVQAALQFERLIANNAKLSADPIEVE